MNYLYGKEITEQGIKECKFVYLIDAENELRGFAEAFKLVLARLKELEICGNTTKNKTVIQAGEEALQKYRT